MAITKEILIWKLKSNFESSIETIADFNGTLTICVKKEKLIEICNFLKDDLDLNFDIMVYTINDKKRYQELLHKIKIVGIFTDELF